MRVLWILNSAVGKSAYYLKKSANESGTWIDATAELLLKDNTGINLGIAVINDKKSKIIDESTSVVYYGVNGINRYMGKRESRSTIENWKMLIEDFKPDIIQIWGTEFTFGLDVLEASKDIPVIIFIQGVIKAIDKYPNGNLKIKEIIRNVGFLDKLKCIKLLINQKMIQNQVPYEAELVSKSKKIIVDNKWSEHQYRSFCSDLNVYYQTLPINNAFLNNRWEYKEKNKNTIFCVAGRTPYKGLHNIIKAVGIAKTYINDISLIIPGDISPNGNRIIKGLPYIEYLNYLINHYNLNKNVKFCGRLTPNQMAEQMLNSNVFVMPSCIENHSSTLREAMYLGVPSISSFSGSIYEFLHHNENGLLYRSDDVEDLAFQIIEILNNHQTAEYIGKNAYYSIRKKYPQNNIKRELMDIYQDILFK